MNRCHWIAPALLAATLAACGGGGGGGGAGEAPAPVVTVGTPAPAPAVVITQANGPTVGAHGLDAAQDTSTASTAAVITGVQVNGAPDVGPLALAGIAQRMGGKVAGLQLASGVQVDQSVACDNPNGSLRLTGNVASSSGLTAGDKLTIVAANCLDAATGTTLNGQLQFEIVSGSFPDSGLPPFHVVMRVTTTALSIQVGSSVATSDGDMTLDLQSTSSTAETLLVSGSSLSSSATVNGVQRSRTLTNYSQRLVRSGTTITGALAGSVSTSSTRLGTSGGSFTVSTPTDLRWSTTSDVPVAGQLKIVGSANTAVLLTFSGASVTVQVDANGDGTYDSSTTSTVTQLRTLL